MRHARRRVVFYLLVWLVISASSAQGSTTLNIIPGNWALSISSADLLSGPGSNLRPVYEDTGSPSYLNITGTSGVADAWRIDVKKVDSIWNASTSLSVKRASDGTGPGSIMGGEAYQQIENTDSAFCSGTADRNNIQLQLEFRGMSLQVPPNTYSTTLVYTVVDI